MASSRTWVFPVSSMPLLQAAPSMGSEDSAQLRRERTASTNSVASRTRDRTQECSKFGSLSSAMSAHGAMLLATRAFVASFPRAAIDIGGDEYLGGCATLRKGVLCTVDIDWCGTATVAHSKLGAS